MADIRPGDRVRVTYTGVVQSTRPDSDGIAYFITRDKSDGRGYGSVYAKEAAGDTVILIADDDDDS